MRARPVGDPVADRFPTRLLASAMLLLGLAFVQAPGFQVADTKFGLVAEPGRLLASAAHLWDDAGVFGQLQNQAYGYVWPMGPWFWIGDAVGAPGWVVQRAWIGLVLVVAFLGLALLARALGVRSDLACLVAGFAYALSPRMLSTVGTISIEAWPSALAPWVLLPLVVGSARGSPARAAALSALAIGMVGGVNAAATSAVLPLGVIWLLTRAGGPRRRALLLWWPVFTLVATAWWLVPLFTLGAYSPPFLDFIESAEITTFPATPFDALRGTTAWIPYLDPGWGAGPAVVGESYLVLNSAVVLVVGLVGMAATATPHRLFLATSLTAGLLLTTLGHQGATAGWGAGTLSDLLDGPLAPLRNIHKFDPVVRVPLVLGLAWALEHAARRATRQPVRVGARTRQVSTRWPLTVVTTLAVAGSVIPAALGTLTPDDPVLDTPGYWRNAVAWLDERDGGTALYAPGTSFGTYRWGEPRDEPFEYLGDHAWAVRNAIPLTPPGTIRYLDAVEQRLSRGEASLTLAAALRRAGVGYLVLRNDLAPGADVPDPVLVRQAVSGSPGLSLVRSFGPEVGGEPVLEAEDGKRLVVNGGWQGRRSAIEVWGVEEPPAEAVAAGDPTVLIGGPEDVVGALEAGVIGDEPTALGLDTPVTTRPPGPLVLTDGLVDRERTFGRVHDAYGPARVPDATRSTLNPEPDYALPGWDGWRTRARLEGARSLSASSSRSDAVEAGGTDPGSSPYAAVDGDPETAWRASPGRGGAPSWRIDLEEPRGGGAVVLSAPGDAPEGVRVRVVTSAGAGEEGVLLQGGSVRLDLPSGSSDWLRVEERAPRTGQLALSEVDLKGLRVRRPLVLPTVPEAWGAPGRVLLRALADARTGCASVDGRTPCLESRAHEPEERRSLDRVVSIPVRQRYAADLRVRGLPGTELEELVQRDRLVTATGSSVGPRDLRASGLAAVDGDPGTTWTPRLDELQPTLTLRFARPVTIRGLTLALDPAAPARRVTEARLRWPQGERDVSFDEGGRADLGVDPGAQGPPIRTGALEISVTAASDAASIDAAGVGEEIPPGVSEVRIGGVETSTPFSPVPQSFPCGTGPDVALGGVTRESRVVASPADLVAGRPAPARLCDGPDELVLGSGENRLDVSGEGAFGPESLVLTATGAPPVEADATTGVPVSSGPARRTMEPPSSADTLVVRRNLNPGWTAEQGDDRLDTFAADGWQQGWLLDGGEGLVTSTFGPDRTYRAGVLVGLGLLLGLVLALVLPARRWPRATDAALGSPRLPAWLADRVGRRRASAVLAVLAAAAAGGLIAGWPGAAAAEVAALGILVLRRVLGDGAAWVAVTPVVLAALAYAIRPWGGSSGWAGSLAWPGYAVVLGVSAVVVLALTGPEPGRTDALRRKEGSSTKR